MSNELISLNEAAKRGIDRLRLPVWAIPEDHLKIDIIDGTVGVWLHLHSPMNRSLSGKDPVNFLGLTLPNYNADSKDYPPYEGPLPDSPEYREKEDQFAEAERAFK